MNVFLGKLKTVLTKYKTIFANLGYLSAIKLFSLIIPIVIYPYLIRVLGVDGYGKIVFAEAIISYLVILISFGFNLSATKEISLFREDQDALGKIVSVVYLLKAFLLVVAIGLAVAAYFLFFKMKVEAIVYFGCLHLCIYEFIFPIWYFQGKEQLKVITYISLCSRAMMLLGILILVNKPEDYRIVPFIYGISTISPTVYLLYIMFFVDGLRFSCQPMSILRKHFIESSVYFSSTISIQIFTNTNKFILGNFAGNTVLAIYDVIEKFIRILAVPITMLKVILLPNVVKSQNKLIVRNTTILMTSVYFIIVVLCFIFSSNIINALFGEYIEEAILLFKLYLPILIIFNLSNYYGVVSLTAFNFSNDLLSATFASMVFYCLGVGFLFIVKNQFEASDLVINSLIVEIVFVCIVYYKLYKQKLL